MATVMDHLDGIPSRIHAISRQKVPGRGRELVVSGKSTGHVVFTDVDDTIKASGGKDGKLKGQLAGCDRSYHSGEIYPGNAQFLLELSRGANEATNPPKVVVLSARPEEIKNLGLKLSENGVVNKHFVQVATANGIKAKATYDGWGLDMKRSQYGSLIDSGRDFDRGMGATKFKGWKKVNELMSGTIFVGDDGQGDEYAAKLMREETKKRSSGPHLSASFMHRVKMEGTRETSDASAGKFYFDTYADAALQAFNAKLIGTSGFERILRSMAQNSIFMLCEMKEQRCQKSEYYRCNTCKAAVPVRPHLVNTTDYEHIFYEVCCDGKPKEKKARSIAAATKTRCQQLLQSWRRARGIQDNIHEDVCATTFGDAWPQKKEEKEVDKVKKQREKKRGKQDKTFEKGEAKYAMKAKKRAAKSEQEAQHILAKEAKRGETHANKEEKANQKQGQPVHIASFAASEQSALPVALGPTSQQQGSVAPRQASPLQGSEAVNDGNMQEYGRQPVGERRRRRKGR